MIFTAFVLLLLLLLPFFEIAYILCHIYKSHKSNSIFHMHFLHRTAHTKNMELHTLLHPDIEMRVEKRAFCMRFQIKSRVDVAYIHTHLCLLYLPFHTSTYSTIYDRYVRLMGSFEHFPFYLDLALLLPLMSLSTPPPLFLLLRSKAQIARVWYFRRNYCLNFDMVIRLI